MAVSALAMSDKLLWMAAADFAIKASSAFLFMAFLTQRESVRFLMRWILTSRTRDINRKVKHSVAIPGPLQRVPMWLPGEQISGGCPGRRKRTRPNMSTIEAGVAWRHIIMRET